MMSSMPLPVLSGKHWGPFVVYRTPTTTRRWEAVLLYRHHTKQPQIRISAFGWSLGVTLPRQSNRRRRNATVNRCYGFRLEDARLGVYYGRQTPLNGAVRYVAVPFLSKEPKVTGVFLYHPDGGLLFRGADRRVLQVEPLVYSATQRFTLQCNRSGDATPTKAFMYDIQCVYPWRIRRRTQHHRYLCVTRYPNATAGVGLASTGSLKETVCVAADIPLEAAIQHYAHQNNCTVLWGVVP